MSDPSPVASASSAASSSTGALSVNGNGVPAATPATPPATAAPTPAPMAAPAVTVATSPAVPVAAAAPAVPDALAKINRELKEKAVQEQAQRLNLTYIDIEKVPVNSDLASVLVEEQARQAQVVPFFRIGKKLRVAVFNPTEPATASVLNELKTNGYLLNLNIASDVGIANALDRLYSSVKKYMAPQLVTQVQESEIQTYEKEIANLAQLTEKLKSITSEEALNLIYVGAIKTGSSDIHFQPEEAAVLVRFRIDGILQKVFEMDTKVFANLANQLKYKSGMKLNINNVPQDGRFNFALNDRKVDVRVSALPTEFGETFVLRLLDSGHKFLTFDQCGFIGRYRAVMEEAAEISHGMILVTGPTGSGKTTTLYSLLNTMNTPEVKIITLEDPIEYHLSGISQSQINEKRGYTFGAGLRSVLRQDPDIVMVGEIRDLETADTAAQAALTGHVLLSTLHTNSAIETIPRLINIGLPPFMVAPSLYMIIGQRLVRKLCIKCRVKKPITSTEQSTIEAVCVRLQQTQPDNACAVPTELWHPGECDACSHTGYSGQIGIHEILILDEELRKMILNQASTAELLVKAVSKGFMTMREDGIIKVVKELTTLEEVERATHLV